MQVALNWPAPYLSQPKQVDPRTLLWVTDLEKGIVWRRMSSKARKVSRIILGEKILEFKV